MEHAKAKRIRTRYDSHVRRQREQKQEAARAFRLVESAPVAPARKLSEVIDAYLASLEAEASPSLRDYHGIANNWVKPGLGDLDLSDPAALPPARLEAWLRSMPGAPNSVLGRYSFLRAAFEFGRLRGLVDRNPINLPRSALPKRGPRPGFDASRELLSIRDIERLASDPRIPEARRILWLCIATIGVRIGELAALRWIDIDWGKELPAARIDKSWSRKNRRIKKTKTGQERDVPLHPVTARALIAWRDRGWASCFDRERAAVDLVLPHRTKSGHPAHLVDRLVLRRFHRDLRILGLAPRRVHSLRHSFISLWIEAGANPEVIRAITHPRIVTPRGGSFHLYRHFSWAEKCAAILAVNLGGIE